VAGGSVRRGADERQEQKRGAQRLQGVSPGRRRSKEYGRYAIFLNAFGVQLATILIAPGRSSPSSTITPPFFIGNFRPFSFCPTTSHAASDEMYGWCPTSATRSPATSSRSFAV